VIEMPGVSVVMTFLDGERFLAEAIESVLAQTYRDWELVLVDDGSTDGGTAIARDYASRHPDRIRYLEHEGHANLGMSASRNAGLAATSGAYVAFLDADDVWTERKLEEQVAILEREPRAAMVLGPTEWWRSWTGEGSQRDEIRGLAGPADAPAAPGSLLVPLLRNEAPTVTPALLRRTALEAAGGFVERFRGMYEDQVAFVKICVREPVFVASDCWYRWRQHPDSTCAVSMRSGEYRAAREGFLAWLEDYLREHDLLGRKVRAALARERRVLQGKESAADAARRLLRTAARRPSRPATVSLGDAGSTTPISRAWGFERGLPVDRYYIERFLQRHAGDIRGRTLEVADDLYTRRFGGDRVERADVLHDREGNPKATLVADLNDADHLEPAVFDCIVFTQTLQFVYDVDAALRALHRLLRPGGVLLLTAPGTTQSGPDEYSGSWYWSFPSHSLRRLLDETFGEGQVEVEAYGNVLGAVALLHGLAAEDLAPGDLDRRDPHYEVVVAARAVRKATS
jgi:glycosyltransferase involved in cell wall biosynthesis